MTYYAHYTHAQFKPYYSHFGPFQGFIFTIIAVDKINNKSKIKLNLREN